MVSQAQADGSAPYAMMPQVQADLAAAKVRIDERAEVVQELMAPMGLIGAALMATIVITFNSWRLSAVAFTVFPLSMGLSLLALALFRYPFGVQALIGVIGSIGVSGSSSTIGLFLRFIWIRCGRERRDGRG